MEERNLRRRLILLYIISVVAVLLVFTLALWSSYSREMEQKRRENFSTVFTSVADRLRTGAALDHSQMRRTELENDMSFFIRDNGQTIFYDAVNDPELDALFAEVESAAVADGCDVLARPLLPEVKTSGIMDFTHAGERFRGCAMVTPVTGGYRSLTVVQRAEKNAGGSSLALFIAVFALAAGAIGFVGVKLIDRALSPVAESRRRQKEFVAAASHELRSPLSVILANASSLTDDAAEAERARATIENECSRMSRLIGDMLLLASADAQSFAVELKPVELDTLLIETFDAYQPVFQKNSATLSLTLPDDALPPVKADAERISQVLSILLDNALSYGLTGESRNVEIEAAASQTHKKRVTVCVRDHGAGLREEQRERIFDRFYRGDASRRDKKHFGLGLSVAKDIIELHGGRIWAGETKGGGCEVWLEL